MAATQAYDLVRCAGIYDFDASRLRRAGRWQSARSLNHDADEMHAAAMQLMKAHPFSGNAFEPRFPAKDPATLPDEYWFASSRHVRATGKQLMYESAAAGQQRRLARERHECARLLVAKRLNQPRDA
jgi:hypothetical protein